MRTNPHITNPEVRQQLARELRRVRAARRLYSHQLTAAQQMPMQRQQWAIYYRGVLNGLEWAKALINQPTQEG